MQRADIKTDFKVLTVSSKASKSKAPIPRKYTCDGDDINPPLDVDGIPTEAKSLALIVEDPDAPSGTWLHWLVWNIPASRHIAENAIPGLQGHNDFDKRSYGGPCPPSGTHRYFFKIYALDAVIDLPDGSSRNDIEDAMRDHIIAYGELEGTYKRK